ncbi:hypothetical protein MM236_04995 [Belliella sp. DSM 107340]|uniref:Uncharacterized protein n=1 Tax=Belliella calami TaxID=2923436 RepID=A0ABS9UL52_9BACT|nr:hypothetical protein [Belliella calami]MCH7397331.1 hypothetical protein [Belliella calami]
MIRNNSENDIELFFYGEENATSEIAKGDFIIKSAFCDERGDKSFFEFFLIDSIQIAVHKRVVKTYYPDSPGKNIFNTQDQNSWRIEKNKKTFRRFVFEITEEDLK